MLRSTLIALAVFSCAVISTPVRAQDKPQPQAPAAMQATTTPPAAKPADVASPDAILAAVYEVISGPAGQARDWDRFRSLYLPGARLVPTGPKKKAAGPSRAP